MAGRLKRRESEIDKICEGAVQAGFKAIELAFEQGDDLVEAKTHLNHGQWLPWLARNFPKEPRTAQRYMVLATIPKTTRMSYLRDSKTINDLFRLLGILPPDAPKQIDNGPSISIPPEIQKLNWLAEFFTRNPITPDKMQPLEREELKTKLRPIVRVYEAL